MKRLHHMQFAGVLLAVWVFSGGCGAKNLPSAPEEPAVPDFLLPDVNPTSATFDQDVSPRHHLGRVSAWYFGHST